MKKHYFLDWSHGVLNFHQFEGVSQTFYGSESLGDVYDMKIHTETKSVSLI